MTPEARFTLVAFHAHPDDEALLTGGTLARAAEDGHRVVLVVATDGAAGLADEDYLGAGLAAHRRHELEASAQALGVARVVMLGYPDSGSGPLVTGDDGPQPFCRAEVDAVAGRLATLLRAESADALLTYDAAGGYGHPDHVQVHRVGRRAAELAGTPLVLEATVDRQALVRAVRPLSALRRFLPLPELPDLSRAYTAHGDLTHRVDVRRHLARKRAAMAAHASQATGNDGARTLALLLRLPPPVASRVLGTEWFREVGRSPGGPLLDDVFASLRTARADAGA